MVFYFQELKPTMDELGILTLEDMGYEKPELGMPSPFEVHGQVNSASGIKPPGHRFRNKDVRHMYVLNFVIVVPIVAKLFDDKPEIKHTFL